MVERKPWTTASESTPASTPYAAGRALTRDRMSWTRLGGEEQREPFLELLTPLARVREGAVGGQQLGREVGQVVGLELVPVEEGHRDPAVLGRGLGQMARHRVHHLARGGQRRVGVRSKALQIAHVGTPDGDRDGRRSAGRRPISAGEGDRPPVDPGRRPFDAASRYENGTR